MRSIASSGLVLLLLAAWAPAQDAHPTARNPLVPPVFTVDAFSPEVLSGRLWASDLLLAGNDPNLPTVAVPHRNMGLLSSADQLDALARGRTDIGPLTTFVLLFSVDRATTGSVPPDPTLAALGYPFNVTDQASINQAACDAFLSLLLFDRGGPIPPGPAKGGQGSVSNNNTLAINGGDAGGVDFRVSPQGTSPDDPNSVNDSQSNVNAGTGAQSSGGKALDVPPVVFFSLADGSPSLLTLPGTGSPADIYVDFDLALPGGEQLYAAPAALGLAPGDDIDALIILENGDYVLTPGFDLLIFSLAPGSPSFAGTDYGPGDLFASSGDGTFTRYAAAGDLGLDPSDNLNMVDLVPCEDVLACVTDWAIGYINVCTADLDGDGDVDLADLAILLASYGTCVGQPGYNPAADLDGSNCVDLADLSVLLSQYGCTPM